MTFAESSRELAPRSLWLEGLRRFSGVQPLDEWLVEEANVRGFMGASGPHIPDRDRTSALTNDDLIVALLAPKAIVDARIFKLVLRIVQSGTLDLVRLSFRARRERADRALFWLLGVVPTAERTAPVLDLVERLSQPRGFHPIEYRFDPDRLVRRPASKGSLWRAHQS